MRLPGRGPGYSFRPTDEELIRYYLKRKVTGRQFCIDGIQERYVYSLDPRDLKGQEGVKRKWYFFSPRERKYSKGNRSNRSTKQGSWRKTGNDRPVSSEDVKVGMIKSLVFYEKPERRTNWVMHEYRLHDEYLKKIGLKEDAFVLCVIFEKDGLGPKNGAQYGSPYREEDWDDANEVPNICEGNTQGVGALSQVCDSNDRGKSIVRNEFDLADRFCVGSSSRTSQSGINQSANHGFQSTPVLGTQTLPVKSQLPLTNQLWSASLGNERGQDIGADQNVDCDPAIPNIKNNICGSLDNFVSLDDFPDSGVNAFDNDSLANRAILPDDSREMDDGLGVDDCRDVSDSFGLVIPVGTLNTTFVGQRNSNVVASDITPSWNMHHHEAAPMDHFISGTQADSGWFISGNPSSSALHGASMDQHSLVSEGSMGFNCQGYGGSGLSWQFFYGLCGQDFGDDVPHFNQHELGLWPDGFGGQGVGDQCLQFAPETDGFVSQSLRENVTPLHGPQFDEDSAWLGPDSVQNVRYSNQQPQTADESICLHGQASMNGQMDHRFAGNEAP
ncbi:hypothetical protein MLD38_016235 [Melastoma candidum]|uniref:Uncharacterized protein n=1 Tax=Melastoma candidum TaxID=119954 RepID=A0ACB9RIT9_9MYRT|nr:hypothetical protein MLD38_016235 [Melastoma candidum]